MYYEEKIINGVLMCRRNPKGDWEQCSITKMSRDIIDLEQQLADLKASLPKVRAAAVRGLITTIEGAIENDYISMKEVEEMGLEDFCDLAERHADKLEAGNE